MLVLSRRVGQSILIDGGIRLTVVDIKGKQMRVAIDAPRDLAILRDEILRKIAAGPGPSTKGPGPGGRPAPIRSEGRGGRLDAPAPRRLTSGTRAGDRASPVGTPHRGTARRPDRGPSAGGPRISRFVNDGKSDVVGLAKFSNHLESGDGASGRSGAPVRSSRISVPSPTRFRRPPVRERAIRQGGRVHGHSYDGIVGDPVLGRLPRGSHACAESGIAVRVPRGSAIAFDRIRRAVINRDGSLWRRTVDGHRVSGVLTAREKWPGDDVDVEWQPRQRRPKCEPDDVEHAGRILRGPHVSDDGAGGLSLGIPERRDDLAHRPARCGIERRAAGHAGRRIDEHALLQ